MKVFLWIGFIIFLLSYSGIYFLHFERGFLLGRRLKKNWMKWKEDIDEPIFLREKERKENDNLEYS